MLTNTFKDKSGSNYLGHQAMKRSPIAAVVTAKLFRDVAKVKNLRKRKTSLGTEEEMLDASVTDELVADHEWEAMLHTFETETDELSPGAGGPESDDLWERLSSTRWLKSSAPRDFDSGASDDPETTPSSETKV